MQNCTKKWRMRMNKKYRYTTHKQFKTFVAECKKWIKIFGLAGWECKFSHEYIDDCRAQTGYRSVGRLAHIRLSSDWGDEITSPITTRDIKLVAFHEVCEVLFARIALMACGKITTNDDVVVEETHNLIHTLENTIFDWKTK